MNRLHAPRPSRDAPVPLTVTFRPAGTAIGKPRSVSVTPGGRNTSICEELWLGRVRASRRWEKDVTTTVPGACGGSGGHGGCAGGAGGIGGAGLAGGVAVWGCVSESNDDTVGSPLTCTPAWPNMEFICAADDS
eukprot:3250729-Prymnesium_polylepis.1